MVGNQWEMKTNCLLLLQLLLLLLRRGLLLLHTTTRTTVPQSKVPVFAFNLAVVAVAVDTLFWETTFVFFPFPPPCDRPKFDPGNWRSRHDETSASFFFSLSGLHLASPLGIIACFQHFFGWGTRVRIKAREEPLSGNDYFLFFLPPPSGLSV